MTLSYLVFLLVQFNVNTNASQESIAVLPSGSQMVSCQYGGEHFSYHVANTASKTVKSFRLNKRFHPKYFLQIQAPKAASIETLYPVYAQIYLKQEPLNDVLLISNGRRGPPPVV